MDQDIELQQALTQISEIRKQLARTATYRGYRALMVASTGVLAFIGGGIQTVWIPNPTESLHLWLILWVGIAMFCLVAFALRFVLDGRNPSHATKHLTWMAVRQFTPCVVAGGLLALMAMTSTPALAPFLPGLWSIVFGLGVFASSGILSRSMSAVGTYYLAAGVVCLATAAGANAFAPWSMVVCFGVGQLLSAAVLHLTIERPQQ